MASESAVGTQDLDTWIELLNECKQLSEDDVKRLCDKVMTTAAVATALPCQVLWETRRGGRERLDDANHGGFHLSRLAKS